MPGATLEVEMWALSGSIPTGSFSHREGQGWRARVGPLRAEPEAGSLAGLQGGRPAWWAQGEKGAPEPLSNLKRTPGFL